MVVDDGSRTTLKGRREPPARECSHSHPTAAKARLSRPVFERCSAETGRRTGQWTGRAPATAGPRWDAIFTLDGDGQHDPAEAPALIAAWSTSGADLVVGARDYESMPPVRWFTNSVSRVLFSWAVGEKIPDNQSGYRLRSRRLAEATLASPEQGFAFEVEEIAICVGRGYKLAWVSIKTIYGTEVSHIKPWTHLVSFIRVTRRARRRVRQERQTVARLRRS